MVHCIYLGVTDYNFWPKLNFFFLKVILVLANSVDPDEMLCYTAFHLDLYCLTKYLFRCFQYTKGKIEHSN